MCLCDKIIRFGSDSVIKDKNMIDKHVIDFAKGDGLVPVIAQDVDTGKVLMLGYANEEAIE